MDAREPLARMLPVPGLREEIVEGTTDGRVAEAVFDCEILLKATPLR